MIVWLSRFLADSICFNSYSTRQSFLEQGGDRSKSMTIHQGIDLARFSSDSASQKIRDRSLIHVVQVGRLAPWKGQTVFVEAAALVIKKRTDVRFSIVGDALFGEYSYRDEVLQRIRDLHLEGSVSFLGFREDIPKVLQEVDIVVHASILPEPYGRVVAEAMASGKAVIATRMGGPTEMITENKDGMLVHPGDPAELARNILELVENPDLRNRLGEQARHTVRERFSLDREIRQLEDVYEQLCAKT